MSSLHAQCPACHKPIDAARATVAKIVGARVLTYCSAECADGMPQVVADAEAQESRDTAAADSTTTTTTTTTGRSTSDTGDSDASVDDARPVARASLATARRTARRRVIAVASLFLVGGMLLTIIKAVSPSSPSEVEASSERPQLEAPAPVAKHAAVDLPPAPPTPAQMRRRAMDELRALLASPSPRVRRLAARSLARTGDKDALALLHKELAATRDQLSQVRMAYAIARGGDESGKATLVKLLKGSRRDVRLDAARSLVRLSDKRGGAALRDMMSYRQFKIGAAGLLARLGDEKAKKLLRRVAKSGRYREERQRATVALGLAGDASMVPALEKILARGPHVGAAHALAVLGSKVAVPQLVAQLDLAAIRVDAAVSLRRLGQEVDLAPLAAGLATGREVARVSAAEAILVLTGDSKQAELE